MFVLRELIVRFPIDGDVLSGLDAKRNYYFFELNDLGEKINESGSEISRKVQVFVHEEIIVEEEIVLDDSLHERIYQLCNNKRVDSLLKREFELAEDDKFRRFLVRFDEVLCHENVKPFPFLMSTEKMFVLYKSIEEKIQHLFYSNLQKIISVIKDLCFLVTSMIRKDQVSRDDFYQFLEDENNFKMFCLYVPSSLLSLSSDRIDALYPTYEPYQRVQDALFKRLPFYINFRECLDMHYSLLSDLENEFHAKLFQGETFTSDEDFETKVLSPVVNTYFANIKETINGVADEAGVDPSEIYIV